MDALRQRTSRIVVGGLELFIAHVGSNSRPIGRNENQTAVGETVLRAVVGWPT